MTIRSISVRYEPPRRRPKIGDRKVSKDGTILVRRQCYTRWGTEWCAMVRDSRPVAEWVPEGTPYPWERL